MASLDAMRVPKQVLWMIFDYVFDDYLHRADMRGRNAMLGEIKTVCQSWRRATIDDDMFMIVFLNKRVPVHVYHFHLDPDQHQPMGSAEGTRIDANQWDGGPGHWEDNAWGGWV